MLSGLREKWNHREVWSDSVTKKMIFLFVIGCALPSIILKLIGVEQLLTTLYSLAFVIMWVYIGIFQQDKLESHLGRDQC